MKTPTIILFAFLVLSCGKSNQKYSSVELISQTTQQSTFQNLIAITNNNLQSAELNDSLAFLVLPVQASCPSCRKKTIDSIMKYEAQLARNHYIIISATGGRKTIRGYFQEQQYEIPEIPGKLFLDSNNLANKYSLYKDKPTMYYTYNQKAFKKVSAVPATVRDDLREFFSGHRQK